MKHSKRLQTVLLAAITCLVFAVLVFPQIARAHSGRTDANGGHNCYVGSCAGTYHYHNGGGSYSAPSTPNYVSQGSTNGKAHAARDVAAIETSTKTAGYQTGYSAGQSGTARSYYVPVPDYICNKAFTFDAGTNETYKTWYQSSYRSACGDTASTVHQASYDLGYTAGVAAKPKPVASTSSSSDSENSNDAWLGWLVLAGFIGLPLLASNWGSIKKYFE